MSGGDYIRSGDLWKRQAAEAVDATRAIWVGTLTNSTNAYTGIATIPVFRLLVGEKVRCIVNTTNTGSATLAIKKPDGLTGVAALTIKRFDGSTNLSAGDLVPGPAEFLYDGTNLRLCWSGYGGTLTGDDETYGAGWDNDLTFPTKNAVYDKVEAVIAAANALVSDTAFGGSWNGVTGIAPSKNAVYDQFVALAEAGTYTPTYTGTANIDTITAFSVQYLRIGTVVHVSGYVEIDPTAAASTVTSARFTLPVASNFANTEDCAGVIASPGVASMSGAIFADTTNNEALLFFRSLTASSSGMCFSFSYRVI